eukprot:2547060-Ditylum_brightwellii.AAC.1
MEYSIVTAYRPSDLTNKYSLTNPLHSIEQGPTDAPLGCTFNADICKKCYGKEAHGFFISDPHKRYTHTPQCCTIC